MPRGYNRTHRGPFNPYFTKDLLVEEYLTNGLSMSQIAAKHNSTYSVVRRAMDYQGLKRRNELQERRKDITGKKFGRLTVTRMFFQTGKMTKCEAVCECGSVKTNYQPNSLKRGLTKSCGCNRVRTGWEHASWRGFGEISAGRWARIAYGAFTRDFDFEVTIEEAWNLFLKQERKCAISGVDLSFEKKTGGNWGTASLDRINSKEGYVSGNVQWVHKIVNLMKQDLPDDQFITWCKIIAQNHP